MVHGNYNLDALHPEWLGIRRLKVVIAPVLTCTVTRRESVAGFPQMLVHRGVPRAVRTAM